MPARRPARATTRPPTRLRSSGRLPTRKPTDRIGLTHSRRAAVTAALLFGRFNIGESPSSGPTRRAGPGPVPDRRSERDRGIFNTVDSGNWMAAADELSAPLGRVSACGKRRFRLPNTKKQALAALYGQKKTTKTNNTHNQEDPLG